MPKYIDVDALWRDVTSNIEDCGDVLEIIERQPTIDHIVEDSKKVSISCGHGNGLISRQAAIDALGEEPPVWYDGEDEIAERNQWRRDVNVIKAVPSAQPEIIHCKDCKHWREGDAYSYCHKLFNCGVLDVYDYMRAEDDFCSLAERWEE